MNEGVSSPLLPYVEWRLEVREGEGVDESDIFYADLIAEGLEVGHSWLR